MGFEFSNSEVFLELTSVGLKRLRLKTFMGIEFSAVAYQDVIGRWYLHENEIIEPFPREEMGTPVFTRMTSEPIGTDWIFECEFSKPPFIHVMARKLDHNKEKYEAGVCIQEQNLSKLLWLLPSAYPGQISVHGDFEIPIITATDANISEYYFPNSLADNR